MPKDWQKDHTMKRNPMKSRIRFTRVRRFRGANGTDRWQGVVCWKKKKGKNKKPIAFFSQQVGPCAGPLLETNDEGMGLLKAECERLGGVPGPTDPPTWVWDEHKGHRPLTLLECLLRIHLTEQWRRRKLGSSFLFVWTTIPSDEINPPRGAGS